MDGLEQEYGERGVEFMRLNVGLPGNQAIQTAYEMQGHPTVVIVDGDGRVQARYFGPATAVELRPDLDAVLP